LVQYDSTSTGSNATIKYSITNLGWCGLKILPIGWSLGTISDSRLPQPM
jgi:hypothetical protein